MSTRKRPRFDPQVQRAKFDVRRSLLDKVLHTALAFQDAAREATASEEVHVVFSFAM